MHSLFCYVSKEKVFDKKQQNNTRDAKHTGNYRTELADGDAKPDKATEKVKYKQHYEAQNCV